MDELQRLQEWYLDQCDDEWEHAYGIDIKTLDNPGWLVEIDLGDTRLKKRSFKPVFEGDSEHDDDWIHCEVKDARFKGACGAENLIELLEIFLDWAKY